MNFRVLRSGDLLITADNQSRSNLAYWLRQSRNSAELAVCEEARGGHNYELVAGGDLCALTDAPLIAQETTVEDDGTRLFYGKVWKHEDYMLHDYLEELVRKGRVIFSLGADFGEAPYKVPPFWTPEYSELSRYNYEHCLD
jgi:hypothetical protein